MTMTWMASMSHFGSPFAMLLCAQSGTNLHVALEGPPLHELLLDTPAEPRLPSLLVSGEQWTAEGPVTFSPASSIGSSFDRTLIRAALTPPPDALPELSITLTAAKQVVGDEPAALFTTTNGRHSRALPGSDLWQPCRSSAPQDYRLLGAAQGRELFYVFCEGPADRESTNQPAGLAYTLFFDDDDQQPPPGVTTAIRTGEGTNGERVVLLVTVPRRKLTPREFSIKLTDRATRRALFEIEAQRV